MLETPCRKAYVSVNLDVDEEGTIRPRFIRWRNGRIFEIDELRYKSHFSRVCMFLLNPRKNQFKPSTFFD